ncbi:ArsR/SmtB family transcription factor [Amnibacterium endophyticum]|uniref:ArsR/SmtB family transcription factor n=1 Tax=Amnibacterium endophyticum TaxID=2109337 RepID=A0ABW4LHK0_9MICO
MTDEEPRRLEVDALKALAHPLRVRIFSELSTFGPATASALGERFGESSGSTSYHLRQLEKHGFVREDESLGNGRERWWERVPGPVELTAGQGSARDAENLVEMEFARLEDQRFADYWLQREQLGEAWLAAAQANSSNVLLDPAELEQLGREVAAVMQRYRGRPDDGTRRRVELVFRGFPVVRPDDDGPT